MGMGSVSSAPPGVLNGPQKQSREAQRVAGPRWHLGGWAAPNPCLHTKSLPSPQSLPGSGWEWCFRGGCGPSYL